MDMKQTMINLSQETGNPFKLIRNWIKWEIQELGAVLEAIAKKEGIEAAKMITLNKIKENKNTIDKMNSGKFTMKGLFTKKSNQGNVT